MPTFREIRETAAMLQMDTPLPAAHGRSICCSASDAGAHPVTLAMVQVYGDGSISVLSGSTEIGQGSHTVLAQIAAEEMGVPLKEFGLLAPTRLSRFSSAPPAPAAPPR